MSPRQPSPTSNGQEREITVLFLGGLGRSGTTVLERLLDREPHVQALGEVVHLWQRSVRDNELCGCGAPFRDCPFWTPVGQLAFGGWDNVDVDRVLHLRDRVDRSKRVPKLVSGLSTRAWRRDLSEYVSYYERLYAAARDVSGCEVVLDSSKQASLPFCLSSSDRIDLRVLHCIRDSRAVAYSQGKQVERPEGTSDESRHMHRLEAGTSAFYWMLHNIEIDFYAVRFGPTWRLRYEDWVEDPGRALAGIRRFAGLSVPAASARGDDPSRVTLESSHTCSGNPMRFTRGPVQLRNDDRWRRELSRRDALVVTSLTWPLLRRYGYSATLPPRAVPSRSPGA